MLYRAWEKGVVGLGYVRLPLAVAFAEVGLRVVGIEKDSEKIAGLETCDSYVEDVPAEHLQPLVASGKLQFAGACKALKGVHRACWSGHSLDDLRFGFVYDSGKVPSCSVEGGEC